jgi:DNA-binding transcriptional MocR family regulator
VPPSSPEQVLVTAGALHALTMAFESVTGEGTGCSSSTPPIPTRSTPNALDAAWALGRRVLPVAVDLERPDEWLDGVERALGQARSATA